MYLCVCCPVISSSKYLAYLLWDAHGPETCICVCVCCPVISSSKYLAYLLWDVHVPETCINTRFNLFFCGYISTYVGVYSIITYR